MEVSHYLRNLCFTLKIRERGKIQMFSNPESGSGDQPPLSEVQGQFTYVRLQYQKWRCRIWEPLQTSVLWLTYSESAKSVDPTGSVSVNGDVSAERVKNKGQFNSWGYFTAHFYLMLVPTYKH